MLARAASPASRNRAITGGTKNAWVAPARTAPISAAASGSRVMMVGAPARIPNSA
ncbi:hypothetical protein MOKP126_47180 [Mycobacterium avium subsp. hominissuis]